MLEQLIGSKARAKLIGFFYLNGQKGFHLREISRQLGINVNQVRRELVFLANLGMLNKEIIGNLHIYRINPGFRLYSEFLGIVRKSAGFEITIRQALAGIAGIQVAFIFGSCAEGKLGQRSDVDLMVLGEPDAAKFNQVITKLERKIGRPIQYHIYPLGEFKEKCRYGFIKNVMKKQKIFVKGDEDGLERT